jgi:agmatinase
MLYRTTLSGPSDYDNDGDCGFTIMEAREIDRIGTQGIIDKVKLFRLFYA